MVYEFTINGMRVKTGDILSTSDGTNSLYSIGYIVLGKLIPGDVDHSILYLGPEGLCVEAGIYGVILFRRGGKRSQELCTSLRPRVRGEAIQYKLPGSGQ
jgi:hypothetical protein